MKPLNCKEFLKRVANKESVSRFDGFDSRDADLRDANLRDANLTGAKNLAYSHYRTDSCKA